MHQIMFYVPIVDVSNWRYVNHYFNDMISDEHFWKARLIRDFPEFTTFNVNNYYECYKYLYENACFIIDYADRLTTRYNGNFIYKSITDNYIIQWETGSSDLIINSNIDDHG